MGKKYLIDSNVIIDYVRTSFPVMVADKLTAIIDNDFNISFINRIEVLGYEASSQPETEFINLSSVYYIDDDIIRETIHVRKDNKIKLPDAIVAATALVHELTLLTRNISDFKNVRGLIVENPRDWF